MFEPILMTKREAEVVDALFRTGSIGGAVEKTEMTRRTLTAHLHSVYQKAGVNSAIDLVRLAYQNGGFLY